MAMIYSNGELVEISAEAEADIRAVQAAVRADVAAQATVLRHQAKIALIRAGLMAQAEAAIAGAGPEAAIWWAEAPTFERGHPLILQIAEALGLDDAELDALFTAAAAI